MASISRSCQRMCAITSFSDHSPQKPGRCLSSEATCPTSRFQRALDRVTCEINSDFATVSTIRRSPSISCGGWMQGKQVVQLGPPIGHFGQAVSIDGDLFLLQLPASQPLIEPAGGGL